MEKKLKAKAKKVEGKPKAKAEVKSRVKKEVKEKSSVAPKETLRANVYSQAGKEVSKITLPENIFGVEWNADLVHDVVVSMQGNARSNSAHTKTVVRFAAEEESRGSKREQVVRATDQLVLQFGAEEVCHTDHEMIETMAVK